MKKFKLVDKKWLVIALIIVVLVVFSVLEEQKSVSTRAIVLAISLDLKDNEYEMGIQVLKTDGQQDKQEFITYSTTGEQLTEVISKLSQDTGQTVSLCHTMVLILGQDLLTKDKDKAIRFFVEHEELCNNTMIVASKGYPLEVYIKNRYRIGGSVYMPCVSIEKSGETTYISAKESFVTDGHNYVILSETATKGLSLTLNKLKSGQLAYSYDSKMGQVDIVKSSSDIKAQKDTATVKIKAQLNDRAYVPENIDEKRSVEILQKNITSYVEECFATCQEQGIDVFFLGQRVYAQGKDFYIQSDFLENMQLKVEVDITMK